MIDIVTLYKWLGGEPILRGVDLRVEPGEIVALVGPSGTGKSVLLKHVVGLLQPDHGDVRVAGCSIASAEGRELARLRGRMGYVFQDGALLDSLPIRDNLRLALDDAACSRDPSLAERRIARALEMVNLDAGTLDKLPPELSGGMRKRVGVARAVINEPAILLYDEPTTGLDPRNITAINRLILAASTEYGATSVVVTHDLPSIEEIADRVVLLVGGRVRFDGSPARFFASPDPAVRRFIGRSALIQQEVS